MKKAVITAPQTVEFWEYPIPEITPGQVLVKVKTVGLCTFEQRYYSGMKKRYPFNGGHEVCGVVEEVGAEVKADIKKGDVVVVVSLIRCGECYYCQRGMDNLCENGNDSVAPGQLFGPAGLSEYLAAEGYQVYKISDAVDFSEATLAEPLACVIRSMEKGNVEPGHNILITGAGVMGLLHLLVAKQYGLKTFMTEIDEARKKRARELGAVVIDPLVQDVEREVKAATGGRGVETVFYTAGGAAACKQGISSLCKGGTMVFYGAIYPDILLELNPNKLHYDEITLTGLVSTTKDSFRKAATLLSEGLIDLSCLVSEIVPFEKLDYGFSRAVSSDTYRVIVQIN